MIRTVKRKDDQMATRSVFHEIVVDTKEDVEKLVDALEQAETASREDIGKNTETVEYIDGANDIRKFFNDME